MKVVIVGAGRQGARLAHFLETENIEVNIIDKNPRAFERLKNFKGIKVLGNGIDTDVLKKAGIEDAQAFTAITDGDNTNLMTAQIAKYLFNVPTVICRVNDPERSNIFRDIGIETICNTTVGARMFRNIIVGPSVLREYQIGDGGSIALEVKVGRDCAGKSLKDLEVAGEFRIASIIRNQSSIIPSPESTILENDHIFGVVRSDGLLKMMDKLGITKKVDNFPKGA